MAAKKQTVYEVLVKTEKRPLPHWALGVEAEADVVLWRSQTCLLTRTVPPRYKGGWRTRKRNEYVRELNALAAWLNELTGRRRQKLLRDIAKERAVQENVLNALRPKAPRPREVYRADFGNVSVGERVGSFSPRDRVDGYW
jgi:hypothetical protein